MRGLLPLLAFLGPAMVHPGAPATQGAPDRAEKFFERVAIQKVDPSSDEERRVVEVLARKEHWVAAFRALEEKVGPFPDETSVKVTFDWAGDEYAHGGATSEKGWVRFNLKKLEQYQKKIDEIDKQRKALEAAGKRAVFRVPPARFDRMIWHELTHVLQRGADAPDWFKEGMAEWVSEDVNVLASFAASDRKVGGIEAPMQEKAETYARGHLFWKWLDSKGAARKTAAATVVARRDWKIALEEATGLPWEKLVAAEQEWSAKEVEKLRPRK
jgi:hypothetical protein